MRCVYLKIINRKTGAVEDINKMVELAKKYEVDKTALWQAERRGSRFLRNYHVFRSNEEEYLNFINA